MEWKNSSRESSSSCWLQHRPRHDRSAQTNSIFNRNSAVFSRFLVVSYVYECVCVCVCMSGLHRIFAAVAILNKIYGQFSPVKSNLFYNNFFRHISLCSPTFLPPFTGFHTSCLALRLDPFSHGSCAFVARHPNKHRNLSMGNHIPAMSFSVRSSHCGGIRAESMQEVETHKLVCSSESPTSQDRHMTDSSYACAISEFGVP